MQAIRLAWATAAFLAFVASGCARQSQDANGARQQAPVRTATAGPSSATQSTAQKPATAVVYAAPVSPAAKPADASKTGPGAVTNVEYRLDLAEMDEQVALEGPARTALAEALSQANGTGPVVVPDDAAAMLLNSLPGDFASSCDKVMNSWSPGSGSWVVRVLFSMHNADKTEAVLGFRCATSSKMLQTYADERPAIASLNGDSATLKLIPLSPDKDGDSTLFRLDFSQAFKTNGAWLVELGVSYSNDNPAIGGEDERSGRRRMILDLASGKQVLDLDERTEFDNHDDEKEEDSHLVCESKLAYLHDGAGNVQSIEAETHCAQDGQPLPDVKKSFRWNAETHQFDEAK